jgi:ABC-2 type transport system permease protein
MSTAANADPALTQWQTDPGERSSFALGLRAMRVITHRELVKHFQDRPRLISDIAQAAGILLVFGVGLNRLISLPVGGINYVQYIFPGVLAINVITIPVLKAVSLTTEHEAGFIQELLISPIPRQAIASGKALATAVVTAAQAALLLVAAPLVGIRVTAVSVMLTLAAAALSALAFGSLGIALASFVTRTTTFQGIVQAVLFPLLLLSGSIIPSDGLPLPLTVILELNPVSYAVDLIRRVMLAPQSGGGLVSGNPGVATLSLFGGQPVPVGIEVGFLAAGSVLLIGAAAFRFGRP